MSAAGRREARAAADSSPVLRSTGGGAVRGSMRCNPQASPLRASSPQSICGRGVANRLRLSPNPGGTGRVWSTKLRPGVADRLRLSLNPGAAGSAALAETPSGVADRLRLSLNPGAAGSDASASPPPSIGDHRRLSLNPVLPVSGRRCPTFAGEANGSCGGATSIRPGCCPITSAPGQAFASPTAVSAAPVRSFISARTAEPAPIPPSITMNTRT